MVSHLNLISKLEKIIQAAAPAMIDLLPAQVLSAKNVTVCFSLVEAMVYLILHIGVESVRLRLAFTYTNEQNDTNGHH